jgi:hypothetical protein
VWGGVWWAARMGGGGLGFEAIGLCLCGCGVKRRRRDAQTGIGAGSRQAALSCNARAARRLHIYTSLSVYMVHDHGRSAAIEGPGKNPTSRLLSGR